MQLATNPLSTREARIIDANAIVGDMDTCPHPECDLTPEVCDLTDDGYLFVAHEEDGVGLDSRTERGERDGCRVPAKHDPTLDN